MWLTVFERAGDLELGRPPGLRPGTPLDATFVLNFEGLDLEVGGYVWQLEVRTSQREYRFK